MWVRLQDEFENIGNRGEYYKDKIATIKKELIRIYIFEEMFKNSEVDEVEGDNWFYGTLSYLDEQFNKLKGERREQWRGVQLKTEDGIEFGSNEDLPKSKNPDISDFDYEAIDVMGTILGADRKTRGYTNKRKDYADKLREANEVYRRMIKGKNEAIKKADAEEVMDYYVPHPDVKGDSIRIKVDEKGDTTRYEHTRTDPNNFLNYWKEIKK